MKMNLKNIRPFIGVLIFCVLLLFGTVSVIFSASTGLILPWLWIIFSVAHYLKPQSICLHYFWNASRVSMGLYFLTLSSLILYTPHWLKTFSLKLENYSFYKMFAPGSYMYGRIFIAFLVAIVCLIAFFFHYRWSKNKKDLIHSN